MQKKRIPLYQRAAAGNRMVLKQCVCGASIRSLFPMFFDSLTHSHTHLLTHSLAMWAPHCILHCSSVTGRCPTPRGEGATPQSFLLLFSLKNPANRSYKLSHNYISHKNEKQTHCSFPGFFGFLPFCILMFEFTFSPLRIFALHQYLIFTTVGKSPRNVHRGHKEALGALWALCPPLCRALTQPFGQAFRSLDSIGRQSTGKNRDKSEYSLLSTNHIIMIGKRGIQTVWSPTFLVCRASI